MKITFILTLAAALCAVPIDAAENSLSQVSHTPTQSIQTHITNAKRSPSNTTTTTTIPSLYNKKTKTPTKTKTAPKAKPTKAPKDACGVIAKEAVTRDKSLSYGAVKGCFEAHKFNPDIAEKTLNSLESLLGNFYAFVDQAKEDPAKVARSPFKTPPVDLMKELSKIRKKKWKNDYEFHMALTFLTFSLNDGHLAYRNYCYNTVTFTQPISLYAPVVNGVQSIRVFHVDTTDSRKGLPKDPASLVDCAVVTIDGQPALQAVQEFSDRTSAISKDPGVRLNDALASTSWYNDQWSSSPGGFASRWELPKKPTMDYTIQCGTDKNVRTLNLTVPWIIQPSDNFEYHYFDDIESYWAIQCTPPDDISNYANMNRETEVVASAPQDSAILAPPRRDDVRVWDGGDVLRAPAMTMFRERGKIAKPLGPGVRNSRAGAKEPSVITQARLAHRSSTTAFYRLTGSKVSDACVAVIATEEVEDFKSDATDYMDMIKGFQKLQDQGCKKLILDMTNNGGGSVDFAYFVNRLFFPNTKPYFVQDLKDTSLVQTAAKQAIKRPHAGSIFDARTFMSAASGKAFKDASMFLKGVNHRRAGSAVAFTQKSYFPHHWPFLPLEKGKQLRFRPENMAIVSNGFCGSACTMIASRFGIVHKVKTYAIGGISKRPLSYFTFPGGFVMSSSALVHEMRENGVKQTKNTPTPFPVTATNTLTVGEIYATENSTVPLEYDAKYFAADVHLDQDPVSARHPDQVWVKIAGDFGVSGAKKN
ncbi:hypothetical protein BGZ65_012508 [Modicella reniformis]|uniref:Tail specific protease domain-containing protein n=1 Tax=Modicella reniformis TaxID=1440133 RepID=A0A9P6LTE5_9FUNG|nr:hypothetical protein BGZ65_012508 [Modicella reniformis]